MYGTYCRLNVNVWDNNLTVIRATRTKISAKALRDPAMREARKRLYREMLDYHKRARDLVIQFRL